MIGSEVPFAADGLSPLKGESPPGITSVRSAQRPPALQMDDDEKIRRAAAAAVHQKYGHTLPSTQESTMIEQIAETLNNDPNLRERIIASMNEIVNREF